MSVKPVIALDIDGTLGDYHAHYIRFAEQWTGRPMPRPEDINPGEPLHKHLGMSKATYRDCKLAYRQGGLKRSMPVYPGASDMIREFRHEGARVWLCTTRPFLRLDNIDPDTRHWLRRNRIQYDGLLYGPWKYNDLHRIVGDVLVVLDDLPEMVEQATRLGFRAHIRDQPYNRHVSYGRVMDFTYDPWRKEIVEEIKILRRK